MKTKLIGNLHNNARVTSKIIIAAAVLVTVSTSCNINKQMGSHSTNFEPVNDSILVDYEGNRYSLKLLLDGNLWMTTNLNLNIPNSDCYENARQNCEQYGRLYSWKLAKQACALLGEQWRLPTSNDWQQLTVLYGSGSKDSNIIRKEAYKALLYPGTSGFKALLGGGRAPGGEYARLEAHGFYWTATENSSSTAWFYNFAKGSQALFQQDGGEKARAFSVRCVKSIGHIK